MLAEMAQNRRVLRSDFFRRNRLELSWGLMIGALAVLAGLQTLRAMSDDAFIPLRCVRRALEGHGLTYNPGMVGEQPCTSPLNLLLTLSLAWVLRTLGFSTEAATLGSAQILYMVSLIACSLAVGYLMAGRGFLYGFLGAVLAGVLALPALSFFTAGLETPMFLALVIWGMGMLSVGCSRLAFIFLALAVLTRHDALLLYGMVMGWTALSMVPSERWRTALNSMVPLVVVMGPWLIFSQIYYGTTIPTTLEAKMAQGKSIYWMEPYYSGFLRWLGEVYGHLWLPLGIVVAGVFGILVVSIFILRRGTLPGEKLLPYVGILVFYSLFHFAVYVGLSVPPYHWYYLPYYVVGVMAGVLGLRLACESWLRVSPLVIVVWLVVLASGAYRLLTLLPLEEKRWGAYEEVGRYLAGHPPRYSVGLMEIGIIGFYCPEVVVFDFGGIVTAEQRERLIRGEALGWMRVSDVPDKVVIRGERHPLEPDFAPFFLELFELEKSFARSEVFPEGLQVWRRKESGLGLGGKG